MTSHPCRVCGHGAAWHTKTHGMACQYKYPQRSGVRELCVCVKYQR